MKKKEKNALVCGAGGFIGCHLVNFLKEQGYWVRGVDIKESEFSKSNADEFLILDLREQKNCDIALSSGKEFDEVYQLAAEMGGMGYIHKAECEILYSSTLINVNMLNQAAKYKIKNYFFASSACVYRDMKEDEDFIAEEFAYPAMPNNEYGWEKLYAERMALAYGRNYSINVKIARFQNCYGPFGTWRGGREKAPAALCRKIAACNNNGSIEVWGDGTALRSYTYVSDLVRGIYQLMQSNLNVPVNLGIEEFVSVNELVKTIAKVAEKNIQIRHIEGPVGVQSRNHKFDKIRSIGWKAEVDLESGIKILYPWIKEQVEAALSKNEDIEAITFKNF